MQYLTLTTSLKKLHTLKELKYSQSLFDQSSFESFEAISGHLTQSSPIHAIPLTNRPNPIQSMDESNPCPTLASVFVFQFLSVRFCAQQRFCNTRTLQLMSLVGWMVGLSRGYIVIEVYEILQVVYDVNRFIQFNTFSSDHATRSNSLKIVNNRYQTIGI